MVASRQLLCAVVFVPQTRTVVRAGTGGLRACTAHPQWLAVTAG
jgi:hypothetical protein